MSKQARLSLPYARWPAPDRRAWQAAFTWGDIFDDGGQGLRLSAAARRNFEVGYARWMGFLSHSEPAALCIAPPARGNQARVTAFATEIAQGRKPVTVYNLLRNLRGAVSIMFPDVDWDWMHALIRQWQRRITPRASAPMIDCACLFELGLDLMAANRPRVADRPRARQRFRDGLIIAFLAARPLRRRSLASLAAGRTLRHVGGTWMVVLGPEDTKTREPLEFPFPETLVADLEFYLLEVWPRFPGAERHGGLWATAFGTAMSGDALHEMIANRTREAFGRPLGPHEFRCAAATTIATHRPEEVGAAQHLLGHRHPSTTRDHYILAGNLQAARAHQEALAGLRKRTYPGERRTRT
jgi:integrase